MTVTFKKAGEKAAKATMQRLRAVTPAEAPSATPARTSLTQSAEPWKNWLQNFLKDNLSPASYEKFRGLTNFMPDDIYDLQQSPKPAQKVPISKTDPSITAMWRYPSPGSQKAVRMPEFDDGEDPYDSGYFKRDTRRRHLFSELGDKNVEAAKLQLMGDQEGAEEELAKLQAGPESSPGNKGVFATGPSDFDPSGLRATMSVSWEKLEESLDQHMPDHLPTATWEGHEDEVIEWYESRDIPVPVGAYYAPLKVPRERRMATW